MQSCVRHLSLTKSNSVADALLPLLQWYEHNILHAAEEKAKQTGKEKENMVKGFELPRSWEELHDEVNLI